MADKPMRSVKSTLSLLEASVTQRRQSHFELQRKLRQGQLDRCRLQQQHKQQQQSQNAAEVAMYDQRTALLALLSLLPSPEAEICDVDIASILYEVAALIGSCDDDSDDTEQSMDGIVTMLRGCRVVPALLHTCQSQQQIQQLAYWLSVITCLDQQPASPNADDIKSDDLPALVVEIVLPVLYHVMSNAHQSSPASHHAADDAEQQQQTMQDLNLHDVLLVALINLVAACDDVLAPVVDQIPLTAILQFSTQFFCSYHILVKPTATPNAAALTRQRLCMLISNLALLARTRGASVYDHGHSVLTAWEFGWSSVYAMAATPTSASAAHRDNMAATALKTVKMLRMLAEWISSASAAAAATANQQPPTAVLSSVVAIDGRLMTSAALQLVQSMTTRALEIRLLRNNNAARRDEQKTGNGGGDDSSDVDDATTDDDDEDDDMSLFDLNVQAATQCIALLRILNHIYPQDMSMAFADCVVSMTPQKAVEAAEATDEMQIVTDILSLSMGGQTLVMNKLKAELAWLCADVVMQVGRPLPSLEMQHSQRAWFEAMRPVWTESVLMLYGSSRTLIAPVTHLVATLLSTSIVNGNWRLLEELLVQPLCAPMTLALGDVVMDAEVAHQLVLMLSSRIGSGKVDCDALQLFEENGGVDILQDICRQHSADMDGFGGGGGDHPLLLACERLLQIVDDAGARVDLYNDDDNSFQKNDGDEVTPEFQGSCNLGFSFFN